MDHVRTVRPQSRSGSHRGTASLASPASLSGSGAPGPFSAGLCPTPDVGEVDSSGDPDSPGPRTPLSRPSASGVSSRGGRSPGAGPDDPETLFFDQPFGTLGGVLLGLLTLLVPLAGVVMDRPLLPGQQESVDRRFRPVAVAESPESPGPGRTAPDR